MKRRRVVALALACVASLGSARHPLHTTITEIAYERSTRTAQITIRAFEDDVVASAMTRSDGGVLAYVARQVALTDRRGLPVVIAWSSIRRQDALVWISGRAALHGGVRGTTLVNRMMAERFRDQVNIVQVTDGGRRQTVLFTPGDGPKSLH